MSAVDDEDQHEYEEKEGPGGIRIIVDRAACIGAADCVGAAPTVFRLDERRRATLLDPLTADLRTLLRAAQRCPTDAIILEDASGHQLHP